MRRPNSQPCEYGTQRGIIDTGVICTCATCLNNRSYMNADAMNDIQDMLANIRGLKVAFYTHPRAGGNDPMLQGYFWRVISDIEAAETSLMYVVRALEQRPLDGI